MKNNNVIQQKSYAFAVKIIWVYKDLTKEKKEFILSKQLLRSGTSVGANIEEAIGAQSKRDFLHKISIAYKEARETKYWIRLLCETEYLTSEKGNELIYFSEEILRLIGSIQKSIKQDLKGGMIGQNSTF